ncbi:metallophosphoesterase [Agromyces seonyuensis]|uniref:Phosphodiesterase n=1 Tax=Agromyces seonyuensis TaxID=2662446 RepID=A0A6I4P1L2_9MICO|nr:metallophosphoesterase [Agromyces seonyuensis]MWB98625.1 phosphodiesterase [Agromyces seonyuensis]
MASIPHRFGRSSAPERTIVHVSDTHLNAGGAPLPGGVDTQAAVDRLAARLGGLRMPVAAIVATGDISDDASADSYARARAALEPVAEALGARLVWVIGNHDERAPFREHLLGEPAAAGAVPGGPVDIVHEIDGLRIIALDSTVPGFHHGELDADRAAWLAGILSTPAPHGTVLALHHAPIASPLSMMDVLELRGQDALADLVAGSDVRLILGGHLHYSTTSTFAGVPVSVAGATAYTLDASAGPRGLVGIDGGRSFDLVELRGADVTVSTIPVSEERRMSLFDEAFTERLEGLDDVGRLDKFSRKR